MAQMQPEDKLRFPAQITPLCNKKRFEYPASALQRKAKEQT